MNVILNLTQHPATPEQLATGLQDLPPALRADLKTYLTFNSAPTRHEIQRRAALIADLAVLAVLWQPAPLAPGVWPLDQPNPFNAMIGGALWLMSALELALVARGIQPLYSFSVRSSTEQVMPDGTIQKSSFKHVTFVEG